MHVDTCTYIPNYVDIMHVQYILRNVYALWDRWMHTHECERNVRIMHIKVHTKYFGKVFSFGMITATRDITHTQWSAYSDRYCVYV